MALVEISLTGCMARRTRNWRGPGRIDVYEFSPNIRRGLVEHRRAPVRRKPGSGMIQNLVVCWPVDKEKSFVMGNMPSNVETAHATDITGHLYGDGYLESSVAKRIND